MNNPIVAAVAFALVLWSQCIHADAIDLMDPQPEPIGGYIHFL